MWQEQVHFENSRKERLSGLLDYPENKPACLALIVGAHPLLGGDMQNNVVLAIVRALKKISAVTLRFDYHGCKESQINLPSNQDVYDYYDELEEKKCVQPFLEDLDAAYNYLQNSLKEKLPLLIAGYSLGAYLTMQKKDLEKDLTLLIAPPFSKYPRSFFEDDSSFCLCAGKDFLSQENIPSSLAIETLEEADHFFRGQEDKLIDWISSKTINLHGLVTSQKGSSYFCDVPQK